MAPIAIALLALITISIGRAELFVSSHDSSQIFRFTETNLDFIDVFVPNTNGRLQAPHGLAFGPDGNLYVASAGNDRVIRYNGETGAYMDDFIPTGSGGLDYPVALVFRGTNLFVSSQLNDRVLRYDAGNGAFIDTFVAPSAALVGPSDMTFGPDGRLYVVGRFSSTVVRYDGRTGAFVDTFINSNLHQPFGLRFLDSGVLLVASGIDNAVQSFNEVEGAVPPGNFLGPFLNNSLNFPIGITLAPHFTLIANYNGDSVCIFDGTGTRQATAPGLRGPNFMAFRPSPQPTLSVRKVGDQIELSWPNSVTDYHITSSEQLFAPGPAGSISHLGQPVPFNGTNTESFTISTSESQLFFRLQKEY